MPITQKIPTGFEFTQRLNVDDPNLLPSTFLTYCNSQESQTIPLFYFRLSHSGRPGGLEIFHELYPNGPNLPLKIDAGLAARGHCIRMVQYITKREPKGYGTDADICMSVNKVKPYFEIKDEMFQDDIDILEFFVEIEGRKLCNVYYPLDPNSSEFVGESLVECLTRDSLVQAYLNIQKDPEQTDISVWKYYEEKATNAEELVEGARPLE